MKKRNMVVKLGRISDYKLFKAVLNKGKHPAFIGAETYKRCALNGGALYYEIDHVIVAISIISPHHGVLLALNVIPEYRSQGLGKTIMEYLMPNYARVIEYKVKWFEGLGYKKIGKMKMGIKHKTQLMVRAKLIELAGNIKEAFK